MAGGTLGGAGGRAAPIVGINVTPMVDIMLVLLVIMMVSANYIVSQALEVDLPKAAAGDKAVPSVTILSVGRDGTLGWNDDKVSEDELVARLKAAHAENPETSIIVNADGDAKHRDVVHAMDLAKLEGFTKFAVSVEQK